MKVSVVVPVYNMEKYLRQSMESILSQTLDDYEVICVDDGSTDSSPQILRDYENRDPRVTVITQKNQFVGTARNNGMKRASGEYICFFDPDDFYDRDMLKDMYDECAAAGADMCVSAGRLYNSVTGEFSVFPLLVKGLVPKKKAFSRADLGKNAFRFTASMPSNKMFRREFINKNGLLFSTVPMAEDIPFVCMAEALADKITVVDRKPYYNYRVGLTTNLLSMTHKYPLACAQAHTRFRERLISAGVFDGLKKAYERFVAFEIERYSKRYRHSPEAFKQYHDWYHEKGKDIYDIHIPSLDAGTLSNLLMTFEGVTMDMDSEAVREAVVRNSEKYKELYKGHVKERITLVFKKLCAIEGAPKAALRVAGYVADKAIAKFTCR